LILTLAYIFNIRRFPEKLLGRLSDHALEHRVTRLVFAEKVVIEPTDSAQNRSERGYGLNQNTVNTINMIPLRFQVSTVSAFSYIVNKRLNESPRKVNQDKEDLLCLGMF